MREETFLGKGIIHLRQNDYLPPLKILTPNPLSKDGEGACDAPSPHLGKGREDGDLHRAALCCIAGSVRMNVWPLPSEQFR